MKEKGAKITGVDADDPQLGRGLAPVLGRVPQPERQRHHYRLSNTARLPRGSLSTNGLISNSNYRTKGHRQPAGFKARAAQSL